MAWEILYGLGAVVLLGGLIWGITHSMRRSRREEHIADVATKELYKHPDRYERKTHDQFEDAVEEERKKSA